MKRILPAIISGAVALSMLATVSPAEAADVTETFEVTASDGVAITATLTAPNGLEPRPTLVEFSPYGRNSGTLPVDGDFNRLLVQMRGTGDSKGSFDAMGPRTQADVVEVLQWACDQDWSAGKLALNGFSASAIIIYNSLWQELPCVEAMVLRSGTHELYRDLLVPGGIQNLVPAAAVMLMIGAPALIQSPDRIDDVASGLPLLLGLVTAGLQGGFLHANLDSWWQQRGFRGNANDIPALIINGFFDVESRGAFQGYQELRDDGAHLLVVGAHDGYPAGTDGGVAVANDWLDHFVRGVDNGVQNRPRVEMLLTKGHRESYLAGDFEYRAASDWPVPGTNWTALRFSSERSKSATSINDGSLKLATGSATGAVKRSAVPAVPSLPLSTDPATIALVGAAGLNALTSQIPGLTDLNLAESLGLTFTTPPLQQDVATAGPLNLKLRLATLVPNSGIWAVLSDVSPDGLSRPLTAGRLNTRFPLVVESKSLKDGSGRIVQPYGDYTNPQLTLPGFARDYQVEFWPVGNIFQAGHRLRIDLVGASALSPLSLPSIHTVVTDGAGAGELLVPVLPGSDLATALGN